MVYREMYELYTKDQIIEFENKISMFEKIKDIKFMPKQDIIKLCTYLGFKVVKVAFPDNIDGALLIKDGRRIIGVNEKVPFEDVNYVTAHELGHYIDNLAKHDWQEEKVVFATKDNLLHGNQKQPSENEMDYLAAAMLVPMKGFCLDLKMLNIEAPSGSDLLTQSNKVENRKVSFLVNSYEVCEPMIRRRIAEAWRYDS